MTKKRTAWLIALIVVVAGFYYWNAQPEVVAPDAVVDISETV